MSGYSRERDFLSDSFDPFTALTTTANPDSAARRPTDLDQSSGEGDTVKCMDVVGGNTVLVTPTQVQIRSSLNDCLSFIHPEYRKQNHLLSRVPANIRRSSKQGSAHTSGERSAEVELPRQVKSLVRRKAQVCLEYFRQPFSSHSNASATPLSTHNPPFFALDNVKQWMNEPNRSDVGGSGQGGFPAHDCKGNPRTSKTTAPLVKIGMNSLDCGCVVSVRGFMHGVDRYWNVLVEKARTTITSVGRCEKHACGDGPTPSHSPTTQSGDPPGTRPHTQDSSEHKSSVLVSRDTADTGDSDRDPSYTDGTLCFQAGEADMGDSGALSGRCVPWMVVHGSQIEYISHTRK